MLRYTDVATLRPTFLDSYFHQAPLGFVQLNSFSHADLRATHRHHRPTPGAFGTIAL
jgi:hypothetical protein